MGLRPFAAALAVALTATGSVAPAPAQATFSAGSVTRTVLEKRVIGYSVRHRPIVAYHLGNPRIRRVSVIIGQMHGDEPAGPQVVAALVHGRPLTGVNLWVVPTLNPDGAARHTRKNAHGVDLNRNWPYRWTRLTGQYYSGRQPLSEPESRAVTRFLLRIRPHFVVSLHQPLHGVDSGDGGRLDPAFRNRLARYLALPVEHFVCWDECHGSMTRWYSAHRYGVAITVEFGSHPTLHTRTVRAPRGIVRAMGGRVTG